MSCSGRSGRTAPLGLAGLRVFAPIPRSRGRNAAVRSAAANRALPACAVGP